MSLASLCVWESFVMVHRPNSPSLASSHSGLFSSGTLRYTYLPASSVCILLEYMHLPFLFCVHAPLLRIHLQSASPREGMKKWEKYLSNLPAARRVPVTLQPAALKCAAENFVFRLLLKLDPPCPHARSMDGYALRRTQLFARELDRED
jgi:hypothetical protein